MKFKPSIDGFDLELIDSVDTTVEKSIVEYEVPFADGAILDDMGVKARRFQMRAIWRRENYDAYEYFVEHVKQNQLNRFVHPELGAINGRVKSVNVVHDARRKCAEISVEFVEDVTPDVLPAYNPPLEANLEAGFGAVMAAQIGATADGLAAAGVDAAAPVDADKPLTGQVAAKTLSARGLLVQIGAATTTLREAFSNGINAAESTVGMFNFGANLPGVIIGDIARALERAAQVVSVAGEAPAVVVSSLRSNITRLCAAAPMLRDSIMIAGAAVAALVLGKLFEKDESRKAALRRIENAPHWGSDGRPRPAPPVPAVITANELEDSLARIRGMIQDAMDAARDTGVGAAVPVLAGQAAELIRYVNVVKMERDRIITVEAEDDMPLHLICLRHGLPYMYADRICTINAFRNPTFCAGEVRIYERRG